MGSAPATSAAPAASAAPTRDDIAAALRVARSSPPEIPQPKAAAPQARRIGADELANLLKRARALMAIGDIAPARLLLERAADAQEASAALLLAQTYDPAVLGAQDMRSVTPDPAQARAWYQRAAQLGSPDAQQHIAQTQK
jgi:TPR repeat protein